MTGTSDDKYRVVHGEFVIDRSSPDGDGVQFRPDNRTLVQFEEFFDGTANRNRAVRLRCDGIDSPELHYAAPKTDVFHQQPRGEDARNALLELLEFKDVKTDPKDPSFVLSASRVRGTILIRRGSSGSPEGGQTPRIVAYLLLEKDAPKDEYPDGSSIGPTDPRLADTLLPKTANFQMLATGEAYPGVVDEMPERHRELFLDTADHARQVKLGVWKIDNTGDFPFDTVDSINEQGVLIYPSLFRKCIDYLDYRRRHPNDPPIDIRGWMEDTQKEDPIVHENDGLQLPGSDPTVLSKVVTHDLNNRKMGLHPDVRGDFFSAVFTLHPWHRVPLAEPARWADLALGETPWAYVPTPPDSRDLLKEISTCRDTGCLVPQRHPFYRADLEVAANGRPTPTTVGCLPITPVQIVRKNIFIMGWFPTAQFSARTAKGAPVTVEGDEDIEYYAPVGNIPSPWSNARYFDGYKVRSVLSADVFHEDYLRPLGIDPNRHTWMTNLIKCFLFKRSHVTAYTRLGWSGPGSDPRLNVSATFDDVPVIANLCAGKFLLRELKQCAPKLIVTLGEAPCSYIHGMIDAPTDRREKVFKQLMGKILPADGPALIETELGVERKAPWSGYAVVHLEHPEDFMQASRMVKTGLRHLPWVQAAEQRRQRTLDHLVELGIYLRDNGLVGEPEDEDSDVALLIKVRVDGRTEVCDRAESRVAAAKSAPDNCAAVGSPAVG